MTEHEKIIDALKLDFPDSKFGKLKIMCRKDGNKTISVWIDKGLFFISSLPINSRKAIYKIINNLEG